jgi:CRP-like cAMP-binding protein
VVEVSNSALLTRRFIDRSQLSSHVLHDIGQLTLSQRTFEPGQYLLREGDRPRVCSFLTKGFAYRHKIVGDGGRQIVSIHIPSDFIDGQNILLDNADHNIQALTDVTVLSIDAGELFALAMAHPPLAKALWHESLVEASIMREWIANIGRRDARSRTAHLLCELAIRREYARLGPREAYELPMTQEQLGDVIGITAVHVNRTLKTLENEGLITRNKRAVTVADWRGLQRVGDFTSAYLHIDDGARTAPTDGGGIN